MRLQGHIPGDVRAVLPHPLIKVFRCFLERAILKEPGEEQIAGLQIGLRGILLLVDNRQQVRRLHVEQCRCHDQELRRTR